MPWSGGPWSAVEAFSQENSIRIYEILGIIFQTTKSVTACIIVHALFNFIMPLFETSDKNFVRLIKAACFLHDVSWRAHPAYRAEVCFDNVTRANLGGIDHQGRAFLAIALLYRYKSPKKSETFSKVFSITSPAEVVLEDFIISFSDKFLFSRLKSDDR